MLVLKEGDVEESDITIYNTFLHYFLACHYINDECISQKMTRDEDLKSGCFMALKADNLSRAEKLGAEPLPSYLSNLFEILFLFHSEDVKRVICPKDLGLPGRRAILFCRRVVT